MLGIVLILVIIVLTPVSYGASETSIQRRKWYCVLVFGGMFTFAALRGETVAIDNLRRYYMFTQLCNLDFVDGFYYMMQRCEGQYGYAIASWLMSRIIPSAHFIGVIYDGFICFTFMHFFYKHAEDIKVASLMYFAFSFSASLNITRQYVACAFFLWAIESMLSNKIIKSLLLLVTAFLFHTTAAVLFLIYALYVIDFKIDRKRMLITSAFAVFLFCFFDGIASYVILNFFPQYAWYVRGKWAVGDNDFSLLWFLIYFIITIALFPCIDNNLIKSVKSEKSEMNKSNIVVKEKLFAISSVFFVIYALIGLLTSKVWILGRLKAFFSFGYYFTVGNVFKRFPYLTARSKKGIRWAFMIGMSVWTLLMYRTDGNGLFPYKFFWE